MNLDRDFKLYARDHGFNSLAIDNHAKYVASNPQNMTPYILEERKLNITQMDVFSRLMGDRIIYFNDEVNDQTMGIIIAQSMYLDSVDDNPIKLYISSGGGSVFSGLGLYDTINTLNSRVETVTVTMSASMGAILASTKKLHKDDPLDTQSRFMLKHARFMIHDIRSGGGGGMVQTFKDQEINLELSRNLRSSLFTILSENSGISYDEIVQLCDRDMWYSAQSAIDSGFMDGIITKR